MKELRLTLLATAGILLEYGGETLLIDGLFGDRPHPFSSPSQSLLRDLMTRRDPFQGIQYLLVTHDHADHFSYELTERFLEQGDARLFLPSAIVRRYPAITRHPTEALALEVGGRADFPLSGGIRLTAIRTNHAGAQFADVEHYCYLLGLGEANLLITGDSAYTTRAFPPFLNQTPIDAVVAIPLFLNTAMGRKSLREVLQPRQAIFYHIPFQRDDQLGVRAATIENAAKFQPDLPPTTLLLEELQSITLTL